MMLRLIWIYQMGISPFLKPACRFDPSCSHYAKESFERFAFLPALILSVRRILKCHPWGGRGYDPVPPVQMQKKD